VDEDHPYNKKLVLTNIEVNSMDRIISSLKVAAISLILIFSLFFLNISYAKAGCCSKHGGVAACNTTTGQLKCKDGTQAGKTCPCKKAKSTSSKGCCSKHGGVSGCNSQTGHLKCKDGTEAGKNCPCPTSKT
jgi:hypothetical protein